MVRSRMKTIVLLGIGVTICFFIAIQMSSSSDLDSPIVYMNSQAYNAALQQSSFSGVHVNSIHLQTQQEPPSESSPKRSNTNNQLIKESTKSIDKLVRINRDSNNNNDDNNIEDNTLPRDYEVVVKVSGGGGESSSTFQQQQQSSFPSTDDKGNNAILGKSSSSSATSTVLNRSVNDIITKNYYEDKWEDGGIPQEPTIWVVTPTFYRPEQRPELTRLAQALLPVRNFIHWIIVDDVTHGSTQSFSHLESFLKRFPIYHTILKSFPPKTDTKIVGKPRGVGGRTAAIQWLRKHAADKKGVVYFADDDNTYDSDIFRQMQNTKKVSMWPVGLVTDLGVSSPIVKNGRVVGFYDGWNGLRKFPVDMAGFAINIQLFRDKPNANMPWVAGYEEDELLRSLGITIQDIKPLANNCTEILVWHTKAVKNKWPKRPKTLKPQIEANTNLNQLLAGLPQKSLSGPFASVLKAESGFSLYNLIFGGL